MGWFIAVLVLLWGLHQRDKANMYEALWQSATNSLDTIMNRNEFLRKRLYGREQNISGIGPIIETDERDS